MPLFDILCCGLVVMFWKGHTLLHFQLFLISWPPSVVDDKQTLVLWIDHRSCSQQHLWNNELHLSANTVLMCLVCPHMSFWRLPFFKESYTTYFMCLLWPAFREKRALKKCAEDADVLCSGALKSFLTVILLSSEINDRI